MFAKTLVLAVLLAGASCRFISPHKTAHYIEDHPNLLEDDIEDMYLDRDFESVHPVYLGSRVRRQAHGVMNTNPDGSANVMAKLPLAGNDKNVLSAIGSLSAVKPDGSIGAASGGFALDNIKGHSLSLTGQHIPAFGNQLTAAGKASLFANDRHEIAANAFATKNMPKNPLIPNFNTYGGGLDYTFDKKIGASLGMSHTDLLKRTDYSAMGHLNLLKNPSSSLDFNAGATKSISPFIPKSSWQPTFGLTYSKYF